MRRLSKPGTIATCHCSDNITPEQCPSCGEALAWVRKDRLRRVLILVLSALGVLGLFALALVIVTSPLIDAIGAFSMLLPAIGLVLMVILFIMGICEPRAGGTYYARGPQDTGRPIGRASPR